MTTRELVTAWVARFGDTVWEIPGCTRGLASALGHVWYTEANRGGLFGESYNLECIQAILNCIQDEDVMRMFMLEEMARRALGE